MTLPAPAAFNLRIDELRHETAELIHLSLSGSTEEFKKAYRVPGQYLQVSLENLKPGFFAIASGPGEAGIELLIKRGNPLTDAIALKKAGSELQASLPMGKGFPLEQAQQGTIFLVGVGSGIAPLRAMAHVLLQERSKWGRIILIYGARTPCNFPYQAEMDAWNRNGIEVTKVCSRPEEGSWKGPVGRVHDALRILKPNFDPGSTAFVCGMKGMVDDVKVALGGLGLGSERIFQNF